MMNTLLESRRQKKRSTGGTIFSIAFHTGIVLFAVFATARASVVKDDEPKTPRVSFVKPSEQPKPVEKKPEAPPPAKKPVVHHDAVVPPTPTIAPPKSAPVLEAPITVPTTIPQIDLSAKATDETEFTGKGVNGGTPEGVEGSTGSGAGVDPNNAYTDFQVERQVQAISGTSIPYPEGMRSAGTTGKVTAEFVVDENGRVQTSTFKVLDSTNDFFTQAVRNALGRMRFHPAQIGRTNVSQVVQQAFVFQLTR